MYILVAYDVDTTTKDGARRLRRVAKACTDYGQRVQNSVFECELTMAQLTLLKARLADIINDSLDTIRLYNLTRDRRVTVLGVETAYNVDDVLVV